LPSLLRKQARTRCGGRCRRDTRCQYGASDWIHRRRFPASLKLLESFLAWPHPRCDIFVARLHLALKAEWPANEAKNHRFEG
jgi:hypothetical protein